MADENRRIQGSVKTSSEDGKYQVAMDLANRIATTESVTKNRDYWLNLYVECWNVVSYGQRKS